MDRENAQDVLEFLLSFPSMIEEKRTFLLIIDGLGTTNIRLPRNRFTPRIFKTVFPSSTPTFFYTFHSLLPPYKHGYLEWYMRFKNLKEPITIPPWKTVSGKELLLGKDVKKSDVFPFKSLSEILYKKGIRSVYYTPYADSVFTKCTSKGAEIKKILYLSEIFPLENCDFSFIYWPSVDTILHKYFKNESFEAEIKILTFYLKLLWKKIPKNSRLIIMSDHGLTKVKRAYLLPSINGIYPVGGGRVAFYTNVEKDEVKNELKKRKIPANVYSLPEVFNTKKINKRCYENFGNVVVIAKKEVEFKYTFEKSVNKLMGQHGGNTMEERFIRVWIGEK